MYLENALTAHADWKQRFLDAIHTHEQLDTALIAADDRCQLGQWLHSEAKNEHGHLYAYARLLETHAAFHREAARVAALINRKEFEAARAQLELGSRYSHASHAVFAAITVSETAIKP